MLEALHPNRQDDALINDKIFPECVGASRTVHHGKVCRRLSLASFSGFR